MATNLNPVDVVMVGLGAANGAAVLPLTRAGIKVTALEAGSWMPLSDFRADEIHNNVDRKSTRLNSSHIQKSRMPSSA